VPGWFVAKVAGRVLTQQPQQTISLDVFLTGRRSQIPRGDMVSIHCFIAISVTIIALSSSAHRGVELLGVFIRGSVANLRLLGLSAADVSDAL